MHAAAWSAGLITAGLVQRFFEVRGLRNLWGVAAFSGRSVVSGHDYRLLVTLASYLAGLIMLILIRRLVLRWITEIRSLRKERGSPNGAARPARPEPQA